MTYRTHMAMAMAVSLAAVLLSPAAAAAASPSSKAPFTWTREKGHVLACTGERNGVRVAVELYENSAFGTHASVHVQTADAEYARGGETKAGLFSDGTIFRRLVVEPMAEAGGSSQTAVISGVYAPAGPRQRVDEVYDEPWGQVVSKGWKTPLSAAVSVNVLGQGVVLTCDDAFAFDLLVRRPAPSGD